VGMSQRSPTSEFSALNCQPLRPLVVCTDESPDGRALLEPGLNNKVSGSPNATRCSGDEKLWCRQGLFSSRRRSAVLRSMMLCETPRHCPVALVQEAPGEESDQRRER
jgi:hypothetical protein